MKSMPIAQAPQKNKTKVCLNCDTYEFYFSTIHLKFFKANWHTPKLIDRLNYESKGENNGRIKSWNTFPSSQHFGGRGPCWSSRMQIRMSDKWVNYSHGHAQTKQQVS